MDINPNIKSDDRYYATANFYLACYLFAKGVELVNVNRENPRHLEFIFSQTPDLIEWIDLFDFEPKDSPRVMVDPRTLISAIKSLKDILHRERNQNAED